MIDSIENREDWEELDEVMSNFDASIDYEIGIRLKTGNFYAPYPGWNFYGQIWWEKDLYYCEIWVHGLIREVVSAETLEDIQFEVCGKFGSA